MLRSLAIAAASVVSACSFEVTPLREQMHAAQSFDAGVPAPPPAPTLDASSAVRPTVDAMSYPPAVSGGTGPMPMDEPDAASAPAAAPHGWVKRLVIDGSQVDAALDNFQLLVRVTAPRLDVHQIRGRTGRETVATPAWMTRCGARPACAPAPPIRLR